MKSKEFNFTEGPICPSDANHIISLVIKEIINYHKIKILSIEERDCNGFVKPFDDTIKELMETKEKISRVFEEAIRNGELLEITCSLEVKTGSRFSTIKNRIL